MIITFPMIVSKIWVTLAFYLTHFSTFAEFHVAGLCPFAVRKQAREGERSV